jgi:type II secretory pathway pseudopilin PulG
MYDHNDSATPTHSMRTGWTVIELIFVIILIGILASIAIGKLAATRDDAKLSADVSNMGVCITDLGAVYTASRINLKDINSSACNNVVCFTVERNVSRLNVDVNATAANYCADVENVGGHLVGSYEFAGASVIR